MDRIYGIDIIAESHTETKGTEYTEPDKFMLNKKSYKRQKTKYYIRKKAHKYESGFGKILCSVYEDQELSRPQK